MPGRPSYLPDSDSDRFTDPFGATPSRRSEASVQESEPEQPPATEEEQEQVSEAEEQLAIVDNDDPESDPDRKRILKAVEKISKGQILAIKKNTQGVIRLELMPAVNDVLSTRTEQVFMIGRGSVTIGLEAAKFLKNHTNHGMVLGICVGALVSGYAPMSQGFFEWLGHGAVKNWRWLWGTTTWFDKMGYAGIKAADMAHMGVFGGIGEVALDQVLAITRKVVDAVHGKPEALETSENLPAICDLYRATEDALLHSSDDEDESRRRHREFRKAFDRLDPAVRHAYLLKVYSEGMARRLNKQRESQPKSIEDRRGSVSRKKIRAIMPASSSSTSVMPYGMNNVQLPASSSPAAAFPYSDTEQSESAGPSTGPRRQSLRTAKKPVSYAPGVKESKRGGGKTIQGLAPILEFNEAADDPYLMRQQVN
jgi:hypothetical protein